LPKGEIQLKINNKLVLEVFSPQKWPKKKGGKNRRICIFGFHYVAKNIKGWLKICYFISSL
jgi:hypothetical protein